MSATKTARKSTKSKRSVSEKKRLDSSARAFQRKTKDGEAVVGIGNLRVVIIPDGEFWFAQGLEINYAAYGKSVEDVKQKFQDGICATIHQHLIRYGHIRNFLKASPPSVWDDLLFDGDASLNKHSQVSWHSWVEEPIASLPFSAIEYRQKEVAA